MILYEEISLSIYFWFFEKKDTLFIQIVIILKLSVFENSENRYKDTSSVKGCQMVLDLLWKYDTNLSCKCRMSKKPWKYWNESSGSWKSWISYNNFPMTLKTLKYVFPWLSWRPWNLPFHKENRIIHQIPEKLCRENTTLCVSRNLDSKKWQKFG